MAERFFPGAHGTESAIVVPMTDFSLIEPDGDRLTEETLERLREEVLLLRGALQKHGFAQGNKIACETKISMHEIDDDNIPLLLHKGSLGKHFRAVLNIPRSPALQRNTPETVDALLNAITVQMMGGNISNMVRSQLHLATTDLGAHTHRIFSPEDTGNFTPWLQKKQEMLQDRLSIATLTDISSRIGVAFPYRDEDKKAQLFAVNTPQGSTINPMRPHVEALRDSRFIAVSEGIGTLLDESELALPQFFNPTSALHVESAIEVLKRKKNGVTKDMIFINDSEWDLWIRVMENRTNGTPLQELSTALFPSPFRKENPNLIDPGAVALANQSHLRILRMIEPQATDHITCRIGIGCGPKGGQYLFQCEDKRYAAAIDTPSDKGAASLITLLGQQDRVSTSIRDVMGAGDAAAVAATMAIHYEPLEEIISKRDPGLSAERQKIAAMAFTAMLGRVFGELAFRSRGRDLTNVPAEAFPRIFDATLDKAIAAAYKITLLPKTPGTVYADPEWDMHFTAWELQE